MVRCLGGGPEESGFVPSQRVCYRWGQGYARVVVFGHPVFPEDLGPDPSLGDGTGLIIALFQENGLVPSYIHIGLSKHALN